MFGETELQYAKVTIKTSTSCHVLKYLFTGHLSVILYIAGHNMRGNS